MDDIDRRLVDMMIEHQRPKRGLDEIRERRREAWTETALSCVGIAFIALILILTAWAGVNAAIAEENMQEIRRMEHWTRCMEYERIDGWKIIP